jgi:hypothetical protein
MKNITYKIYRENGALNSPPIFDAIESGLSYLGYKAVDSNEDLPIIWSVLWQGRMEKNQQIYFNSRHRNKPVLIVEIGNLKRNITWRISLNNVNNYGIFANDKELDIDRPNKLGLSLKEYQLNRRSDILLTTQHEKSLQWQGMPPVGTWVTQTIEEIKKYSNRRIVVRPHPRWNSFSRTGKFKNIEFQLPKRLQGTYDDFDIDYGYHCVINHNSGPAIQASIKGIPVICHNSSLAHPVSNLLSEIETLRYVDREDWFLKLCHTEWTRDEISAGVPLIRLQSEIEKFFF